MSAAATNAPAVASPAPAVDLRDLIAQMVELLKSPSEFHRPLSMRETCDWLGISETKFYALAPSLPGLYREGGSYKFHRPTYLSARLKREIR